MTQLNSDDRAWASLGVEGRNHYRIADGTVDMTRPARPVVPITVEANPQTIIFDANKTALIVVDMQNEFCAKGGWMDSIGLDFSGPLALLDGINGLTKVMRDRDMPVIWLNWGVRPDRLNLPPSARITFDREGRGHGLGDALASSGGRPSHHILQQGSWGAALVDGLVVGKKDIHVDKHRVSGFFDTPLDSMLRNLGVTTLLFAGINADHCVFASLMDANFLGYDTIMVEDCVTTSSPEMCTQATLHNVRFAFGFTARHEALLTALEGNAK